MQLVPLTEDCGAEKQPASNSRSQFANYLAVTCFAAFSVVYFLHAALRSGRDPLDVDEVFVIWIERYFSSGRIVDALRMGLDTAPPAYYWLVRGFCRVFGTNALAIRLPSIGAYYIFCLSAFYLTRKRVSLLLSVFAFVFCAISGDPIWLMRGRPYAIVMACFGIACCLWVDFPESRHKGMRAALTALVVGFMASMHFLSVIEIAALGIAEILRSWKDRRIQWRYWAGLVAGACCMLAWWPVVGPIYRLSHASVHAPGFYAKPTIPALIFGFFGLMKGSDVEILLVLVTLLLLPLLLVLGPLPADTNTSRYTERGFQDLDFIAFAALTLPLLMFAVAGLATGSFNTRYFLSCILGLSLLAVRGLHFLKGGVLLASVLLVLTTFLYYEGEPSPGDSHDDAVAERIELLGAAAKPLPIVLPSASDFFLLHESVSRSLQSRLTFVGMPSGTSSPDPEPELIARNWKAAVPDMRIYAAEPWFSGNQDFYLLYTSDSREGLTSWLLSHAGTAIVAHRGPLWLMEVSMPDQAAP